MVERSVAKSGSDVSTQSMASELRGRVMVMEMGGSCEARPDTYKPNYDYKGVGVGLDHFSHVAPFVHPVRAAESVGQLMKVKIKSWHAIAQWRWDTGNTDHDEGDGEGDVCGICRVPYEGCCPTCKVPGDDCPLSECATRSFVIFVTNSRAVWGECSHVFHMHCLLKWIGTPASKQQCPMDRRTWGAFSLLKWLA